MVKAVHLGIDAPNIITDITSAEMIKYASNAFLATRISFINEIALLCDRVGASIHDVSDGLALDGIGLDIGVNLELLRTVISVNNPQLLLPLCPLREEFGDLTGVRVAVLGLAFKPRTDDVREAPALGLVNSLVADGAIVTAYGPQAADNARKVLPRGVRFAPTA